MDCGLPALPQSRLAAIMPTATPELIDRYYQPIVNQTTAAQINTALRLAHFLAQIGNETGDLRVMEENLNYDVLGLMRTWPSLFDQATAEDCAHQPEKIANRAYGNRYGNGNEASGDGWRFRGRGAIQLTFQGNYAAYGRARNRDFVTGSNSDLIASDPNLCIDVACWYWTSHNLNLPADRDDIISITKSVNGGLIGLAERERRLANAKHVLGIG
jgi:putative chitinase